VPRPSDKFYGSGWFPPQWILSGQYETEFLSCRLMF
jgi:hypothetical protein